MKNRYNHGDIIYGDFQPRKLSSLRPEVKEDIGKPFKFKYLWLMDEDDPYPNQAAFQVYDLDGSLALDGYWVPEEDIDIAEE